MVEVSIKFLGDVLEGNAIVEDIVDCLDVKGFFDFGEGCDEEVD